MKTKHKLKLLAILTVSEPISKECKSLRDGLCSKAIGNPKIEPIQETKPEPIAETFEVGEIVEVVDTNPYNLAAGTQLKIIDNLSISKHCTCELNNQDYFLLPSEIKKIPIQKDNPKEFKVGDKVKIVEGKNGPFYHFKDGEKVVICALHNDSKHGLCAYCNNGHTTNQWVSIKELEHI